MSDQIQDPDSDTIPLSALVSQINSDQASAQRTADRYARSGALDTCCFDEGYKTQLVFACLTCRTSECHGFCLACSMNCHVDHEVVETGRKRHFRCDCGTSRLPHPCQLSRKPDSTINDENRYNQNFMGLFCHCSRPYDPETESKDMIMCCRCEDWFHDDPICIGEAAGQQGSQGLYLCTNCIKQASLLLSYIGTSVSDSSSSDRRESGCCKPIASVSESKPHGTFLPSDIMTRICRCDDCLQDISQQKLEFLIGEDQNDGDDNDDDDESTNEGYVESLGQGLKPEFDPEHILERALSRIPRELAIEGAMKFRQFTDSIILGLKQITSGDENKVITAEDVHSICTSILGKRTRDDRV